MSLRTEFDALKARFEALCTDGKMSPEGRALVDALLMLFELLLAVFLEKNTPKSSRNSGLPSSQTGADETARVRTGAQGKGPKSRAALNRVVVETRTAPVTECRACGRDLEGVAPAGHERRRWVDLVFETRELTVEAEIKTGPRCRTEPRGAFPKEMPGPLQYGHGIVAFAVHLLSAQMVSLKRTAQTLKALTGRAIAEATLLAWLRRLHEALADWEAAAVERLLAHARAARGRNLPARRAQKPLAAQLRLRQPDAPVRAPKARPRRPRRTQRHPPLRRHPDPRPLGQLLRLPELRTRPVRQPSAARPHLRRGRPRPRLG